MDGYTVGGVAASVSIGKSPGILSKLFANAPSGYTVKYVPVKQQAVKEEVRSPVYKSVREPVIKEESNNVHEKGIKKERTEVSKHKKRKIKDMFDNAETEATDIFKNKKKKGKVELNYSGDTEILSTELAQPRKKKKKIKLEFVPSEVNTEVPDKKTEQTCEENTEKIKQKVPISEFTELMPLKKKKKKQKERNYETADEGAMKSRKEDTFSLSLETEEYNEDNSGNDESDKEDEEELSNKQCALKRLEKKRLQENKLQHADEEQNAKTVFVGNVPNDIKKKRLMKFFSKYGAVKSVRLRCAPLADPRVPKKVAIIKQKYHPERSNIHAFVCFEDVKSTHKALEANGTLIGEHHIRVDLLNNKQGHDQKKAVFIGNLAFAAEEDDLWKMFEPCGTISNVRIVRDRVSGVGKGFAYINFESADAVELALKLNGEELKKRKLRISRYARKPIGKFVNKQMLHKPGFQKNAGSESTTKERKDIKERFKHKHKPGKAVQIAENGAQRIVKKIKASYQGQKMAEKKKMKKDKRKANRAEMKKRILANKLGAGPKSKTISK